MVCGGAVALAGAALRAGAGAFVGAGALICAGAFVGAAFICAGAADLTGAPLCGSKKGSLYGTQTLFLSSGYGGKSAHVAGDSSSNT